MHYLQASNSSDTDSDSDNLMISQELRPGFCSTHNPISTNSLAGVLEEAEPDAAVIDRGLESSLNSLKSSMKSQMGRFVYFWYS